MRTGARPSGSRTRRAVTLIEMIVLIIMMAVLSSVAVPAFSRLRDRAVFDARIGEIIGFFAEARAKAIDLSMEVEVRYDHQTDTFTALGETTMSGADLPTDLAETAETATVRYERALQLPSDYRILDLRVFGPDAVLSTLTSGAETVFRFREDGTCDGVRFTLTRATGQAATLTLWPSTGTVDVEPPTSD